MSAYISNPETSSSPRMRGTHQGGQPDHAHPSYPYRSRGSYHRQPNRTVLEKDADTATETHEPVAATTARVHRPSFSQPDSIK